MTITTEHVKRQAKRIARATTVTHAQALDVLAVQNGFSHWAAYSRHLHADTTMQAPSCTREDGMCVILEKMLGRSIPDVKGCRHLVVSGVAGAGKTTFVNKMLSILAPDTSVVAVEDVCEVVLPPRGVSIGAILGDRNHDEAWAIGKALRDAPDILVCTLRSNNIVPILDAMERRDGTMMIIMAHASDLIGIGNLMARYAGHAGRVEAMLPAGVAGVQIEKNHFTGGRNLTEIRRI